MLAFEISVKLNLSRYLPNSTLHWIGRSQKLRGNSKKFSRIMRKNIGTIYVVNYLSTKGRNCYCNKPFIR